MESLDADRHSSKNGAKALMILLILFYFFFASHSASYHNRGWWRTNWEESGPQQAARPRVWSWWTPSSLSHMAQGWRSCASRWNCSCSGARWKNRNPVSHLVRLGTVHLRGHKHCRGEGGQIWCQSFRYAGTQLAWLLFNSSHLIYSTAVLSIYSNPSLTIINSDLVIRVKS